MSSESIKTSNIVIENRSVSETFSILNSNLVNCKWCLNRKFQNLSCYNDAKKITSKNLINFV